MDLLRPLFKLPHWETKTCRQSCYLIQSQFFWHPAKSQQRHCNAWCLTRWLAREPLYMSLVWLPEKEEVLPTLRQILYPLWTGPSSDSLYCTSRIWGLNLTLSSNCSVMHVFHLQPATVHPSLFKDLFVVKYNINLPLMWIRFPWIRVCVYGEPRIAVLTFHCSVCHSALIEVCPLNLWISILILHRWWRQESRIYIQTQ